MALLIAMSLVAAAVGGIIFVSGAERPTTEPVAIDAGLPGKTSVATRGAERVLSAPVIPSASGAVPKPSSTASRPPQPVTGLNQAQMNNAAVIVQVARERGLSRRAMLVAMMTGLQESSLRNLANPAVPASLDRPNEGSGNNFDSIGVFQQRPSQGWGTVAQLMNPRYAAGAFYERLFKVSDWESKSLGDAAQAVQRSAAPDAYADQEKRATKILDVLL
ncbi:hypothetical protein ODJ79_44170 [Actinoplanes sp. KI2]|uniref:hypothetical protein n=1 Tax=Actinoplanes sp. KI2 TaxID=2983315 RepID=UPI0021D56B25|nr:hypothetical protein [Actinoplanes sp. KI2]MCU7730754.1 hypothetical protein [Actinoplanes sp. KI2]